MQRIKVNKRTPRKWRQSPEAKCTYRRRSSRRANPLVLASRSPHIAQAPAPGQTDAIHTCSVNSLSTQIVQVPFLSPLNTNSSSSSTLAIQIFYLQHSSRPAHCCFFIHMRTVVCAIRNRSVPAEMYRWAEAPQVPQGDSSVMVFAGSRTYDRNARLASARGVDAHCRRCTVISNAEYCPTIPSKTMALTTHIQGVGQRPRQCLVLMSKRAPLA